MRAPKLGGGYMSTTSTTVPKTKTEALERLNTLVNAKAHEHGERPPGEISRFTEMHHWMFKVGRDEALLNNWPMKTASLRWTSGDIVATFIDHFKLAS
ncbi:MAG: hypothetical protein Athens041674_892 [Parcubacteria group bacterium Athens0416_74]|nr:MAG: hypothetical protein Athens041674_892 [Parcubacteria group bacterium Athens0416_74]